MASIKACLLVALGLVLELIMLSPVVVVEGVLLCYVKLIGTYCALAGLALLGYRVLGEHRPPLTARGLLVGVYASLGLITVYMTRGLLYGYAGTTARYTASYILVNVALTASIALGEELLYRGLMLRILHDKLGPTVAVVVSALAYLLFSRTLLTWYMTYSEARLRAVIVDAMSFVIPAYAMGLLLSTLPLLVGLSPAPSVGLRASVLAFHLLTPIAPLGPWWSRAFVNTLAPIVGLACAYVALGELSSRSIVKRVATRRRLIALAVGLVMLVGGLIAYAESRGIMVTRPYVILTGSMEPTIRKGDIVILRRVDPREVRKGVVVAYTRRGNLVVHRVVEVRGDMLVTKGDANDSPDPWLVDREDVVGVPALVIPWAGWPSIYVRVLGLRIVGVAALACILVLMVSLLRERV